MDQDRAAAGERGAERRAGDPLAGRLPPVTVTLLRGLLVLAATYATGALGFALPHFGARLALPILPSGVAVGALVRWGRGLWPAVFAAELAIELSNGTSLPQSLVVACGLPAGAWATAWILERYRLEASFAHSRDVPLFLAASLCGMALPATFGTLGFAIGPATAPGNALVGWFRWWSNTTAGVLLVAPLLIAARGEFLDRLRARPLAGFALVLAVALLAILPLTLVPGIVDAAVLRSPVIVVSLVLVVVGAMRFGLVASAAATLALSTVAALSFAFDRGLLQGLAQLPGLILLWSYVGAMTGFGLIVTTLLAERDAAAAQRLQAERRYAQVFEASPQPLWVYDPTTLRFLLVNQATLRQYGYSREALLGMRVTDLSAPGEERAVPGGEAALRRDGEPFETRHVSRDGRVLEVEMWSRPIGFGGHSAVLVFASDVTERKALGRAFIDAIAGEQRRIGQEMHDGLGQELTGLSLSIRALAIRASRERLPLAPDLDQLAALISACIQSARRIVHGLSPLSGADGNLVAALTHLAEHGSVGGVQVRLHCRLEAPLTLPLEARNHLFRIAQEALQNAQKHAGARHIDIEFAVRSDAVRLAVLDDGTGPPDPARPGAGLGMRTMRYRAAAIGGRLGVGARHPSGTAVLCEAPQTPAQAGALPT
jgi:PAS domain S-box-containing protein